MRTLSNTSNTPRPLFLTRFPPCPRPARLQPVPTAAMAPLELVRAIRGFVGDRAVVAAALKALCAQAAGYGREDEIVAVGAVVAIVEAISKHSGDAEVCEHACAALSNLAVGSSASANCDAIVSAGAIGPLIAALVDHVKSEGVCCQAFTALHLLADSSVVHKETIVGAGAVAPLMAIGRTHGSRTKLYAHEVLEVLGFNGDGSKK